MFHIGFAMQWHAGRGGGAGAAALPVEIFPRAPITHTRGAKISKFETEINPQIQMKRNAYTMSKNKVITFVGMFTSHIGEVCVILTRFE